MRAVNSLKQSMSGHETIKLDPLQAVPPPDAVSISTADTQLLDKHLMGGVLWTAASKWSAQLFTWAALVVVTRLLTPADVGLVGMATVYLSFAQIVSEFGFGSAVITLRNLSAVEIAQINAVSLIAGAISFAASCAVAVPLGVFFHAPKLAAVIVVMSLNFLFGGLQSVPCSLLQRELRFKRVSLLQTIVVVVQSATTLILAELGYGYWALAFGSVLAAGTSGCLFVLTRPVPMRWPDFQALRHALRFSWQVLVARVTWNFYSDSDFLVAGRVLGAIPLGAYSLAWNLATMPVEKVTALISQVTPAIFAASQTDHGNLRRYLRNLTEAVSLLAVPASLGLGIISAEFIPLVLGSRWSMAIGPLEVLAYFSVVRSIAALFGPLLTAIRETRFVMWNNMVAAMTMPVAFYIGSHWGPMGIALAWVAVYPFIAFSLWRRVSRRLSMRLGDYLSALLPAVVGSTVMVVIVISLKHTLPYRLAPIVRLGTEIIGGALTYALVILGAFPHRARAFIRTFRKLRLQPE